jgi:hypothetical protein
VTAVWTRGSKYSMGTEFQAAFQGPNGAGEVELIATYRDGV